MIEIFLGALIGSVLGTLLAYQLTQWAASKCRCKGHAPDVYQSGLCLQPGCWCVHRHSSVR